MGIRCVCSNWKLDFKLKQTQLEKKIILLSQYVKSVAFVNMDIFIDVL